MRFFLRSIRLEETRRCYSQPLCVEPNQLKYVLTTRSLPPKQYDLEAKKSRDVCKELEWECGGHCRVRGIRSPPHLPAYPRVCTNVLMHVPCRKLSHRLGLAPKSHLKPLRWSRLHHMRRAAVKARSNVAPISGCINTRLRGTEPAIYRQPTLLQLKSRGSTRFDDFRTIGGLHAESRYDKIATDL